MHLGADLPRRAGRHVVARQSWRTMLFLHWRVPAEQLQRLLPAPLRVDTYGGTAWVTVLPFEMQAVRPVLVPRALGIDLLETNVRTYVRGPDGARGIWFFSLETSSLVAVAGARLLLGLPYRWARMKLQRRGASVEYESSRRGRRARLQVAYEIAADGGGTGAAAAGSLDEFLVERYSLYSQTAGLLVREDVAHGPYSLQDARVTSLEQNLLEASGVRPQRAAPDRVHYSPGVDVDILAPALVIPAFLQGRFASSPSGGSGSEGVEGGAMTRPPADS